jgi:hypothetical protein
VTDRNTLAGFIAYPSKLAKLREEWSTRTADTTGCPGCNCKNDDDDQADA